jgi:hypothetical protein
LNQKLFVGSDVSLNQKLFVGSDISLNQKLFVGSDVSLNQALFVGSDVSMNQRLFVGGDVSMNQRLFIGSDISINGNIFIGGSLITRFQLIDNNYSFINANSNNYLNINNGNHFWISPNFNMASFYLPNQIPPDGFFLYFRKLYNNTSNISINIDSNYANIYDTNNNNQGTSYSFTTTYELKMYYSSYDTSWYVSN